ncbi:MAG: rhodanese-like domain-containing protein [Methylococcales bacterium]|nr:rhodanese-like domain-containing protein [Methylococcales bacterium]
MPTIKTIDPQTAKAWLSKQEAILIDVREPGEYAAMHIEGAILLPLNTLNHTKLPALNGKKLIIHCHLGRRGESACEKLLLGNPELDVYNLEGGLSAWDKAGFAVERSEKCFLSIDRQVQMTIGSFVLLGVILGHWVYPGFLLLAAFFGAGLLFAGITGSCGLAILMSKMPWNQKR